MLHLKVDRARAESAKRMLSREGMLDTRMLVQHRNGYVYFPVSNIDTAKAKKVVEGRRASLVELAGRRNGRLDYGKALAASLGRAAMARAVNPRD